MSTESDLNRHPKIPTLPAQQDSTPLMAESHDKPAPVSTIHPAYRANSWGNSNINERNPFTPQPPVARKPVPTRHSNGHPALAAGAGAAVGAAAAHHHYNKKHEDYGYTGSHRPLSSHPVDVNTHVPGDEQRRDIKDPNRPPTPFGLNAFIAAAPQKRTSKGAIEPSIADHGREHPQSHLIDYPTDSQRRSLHEHDMLAADPPIPERSPKRASFGSEYRGVSTEPPRTAYHEPRYSGRDQGYVRDDSDGSNDSWQSAQAAQPTRGRPYWEDARHYMPEPRQSEDHGYSETPLVAPNAVWNNNHRNSGDSSASASRIRDSPWRLYGPEGSPRRSIGPDGKPRRLRFSDLQPEEYHYDYDEQHPVGQAL